RPVRQNRVAAGQVRPHCARTERAWRGAVAVLHVAIVSTDHRTRLVLWFESELVNKRAISQCPLNEIHADGRPATGAGDCFPDSLGADNEMVAATRWAIIDRVARNPLIDFVRENERLNVWRTGVAPWAR